jgi:uncharacterized protein (DUF1697 family)
MTEPAKDHVYVAFLRAINVGGRNVRMDALRTTFESLGFADVSTFIASGNVLFRTASPPTGELERQIEAGLRRDLGFEVDTFVRSAGELADIASDAPVLDPGAGAGAAVYVAFLEAEPDADGQRRLLACRDEENELSPHGREFYWLSRSREGRARLSGSNFERAIAAPATMRNMTTVRKLAAKLMG